MSNNTQATDPVAVDVNDKDKEKEETNNNKECAENPKVSNKRVFILGVVMTLLINLLLLAVWYVFSSNNNVPSVPIIGQTIN